jgi:uncharacterized protein (UPF0261 family)
LIVIVATLDTKGEKAAYLNQLIKGSGMKTVVIDSGVLGVPYFPADISREKVAEAAGQSLDDIASLGDETEAMKAMARGTTKIVNELYASGEMEGVIGVTGSLGMSLWLSVMKTLPVGLPKVLCCTTAFLPFAQPERCPADLIVVPLVSDIWGINSLTRRGLENASGAITGTAKLYKRVKESKQKELLAISTLGTSALKYIAELTPYFENMGYEVAAFHIGQGQAMEQLIREGTFRGVLDLSLIELSFEACSLPFISSGRLEAAVEKGTPQVVAPGGICFVVWWGSLTTMPEKYKQRKMRLHGELAWQIEMSLEEVAKTAELVAKRLNKGNGPRAVVIPKQGFVEWDRPGGLFYNPHRSEVFSKTLKDNLNSEVEVIELDAHVNDKAFVDEVARVFMSLI